MAFIKRIIALSAVAVIAFRFPEVDGRRPLHGGTTMERRPAVSQNDNINKAVGTKRSPLVQAGKTCPSLCFFKDDIGNKWCMNFEAPAL